MKHRLTLNAILAVLSMALVLPSCLNDSCDAVVTYTAFQKVYVKPSDFRKPITMLPARQLESPGKIYVYQDYLFVNEMRKGVLVIDNSNPSQPQGIGFLDIPGNVDIAVRNNILYADNYVDVVAIDISNPANPVFVGRSEEALPHNGYSEERGYFMSYQETTTLEEVPCNQNLGVTFERDDMVFVDLNSNTDPAFFAASNADGQAQGEQTGQGGSLARFAVTQGHLYVIDNHRLHVFDLTQSNEPARVSTVILGWGIETIFPVDDKIFIGASNGMHILDNSNPAQPRLVSTFQHATACDPVFVEGNIAYVTLRDGQECLNFTNQLDVVSVADIYNPQLIKSFPMHNPHGLSKNGDALFICENEQGVKIFDASDPNQVGKRQIGSMTGFQATDIITIKERNLAIVIGRDGLFQYDISNPAQPVRMSDLMQL